MKYLTIILVAIIGVAYGIAHLYETVSPDRDGRYRAEVTDGEAVYGSFTNLYFYGDPPIYSAPLASFEECEVWANAIARETADPAGKVSIARCSVWPSDTFEEMVKAERDPNTDFRHPYSRDDRLVTFAASLR